MKKIKLFFQCFKDYGLKYCINNLSTYSISKEQIIFGPELVQFDLTDKCNNSCIGCWIHSPKIKFTNQKDLKFISKEKVFKTLKQLKKLGTKRIIFSGGGEPFTHPDIISIIKKSKKLSFKIALITNFNLLNKKKIKTLTKLKIEELFVSIWAATPKTYIATHPNQTKNNFETLEENLKYLMKEVKRNKVSKVRILNVLTNKNHHELIKMIKFGESIGVHEIEFTLIDTIKNKTDQFLLNKKQQEELKKQIAKYKPNGTTHVFGLERFKTRIEEETFSKGKYDKTLVDSIPCYAGYTYARIIADGKVIPCCKAHLHPLGNINQKKFKEIWFSKDYEEFRLKAKNLKKSDFYFKKIDCYKGCDNYIENLRIHNLIKNLK